MRSIGTENHVIIICGLCLDPIFIHGLGWQAAEWRQCWSKPGIVLGSLNYPIIELILYLILNYNWLCPSVCVCVRHVIILFWMFYLLKCVCELDVLPSKMCL